MIERRKRGESAGRNGTPALEVHPLLSPGFVRGETEERQRTMVLQQDNNFLSAVPCFSFIYPFFFITERKEKLYVVVRRIRLLYKLDAWMITLSSTWFLSFL
jgi:hypothetical protein